MADLRLIQVTAPHFVAAVVIEDDRVVRYAPILSYMRGWTRSRVQGYCQRKGWTIEEVGSANRI